MDLPNAGQSQSLCPSSVETQNLHLRVPRTADAAALSRLVTPSVSRWVASWAFPFTQQRAAERISTSRKAAAGGLALPYVIESKQDGQLLGWIGVTRQDGTERTAMLGYWLAEHHHGRGFMREASRAVVRTAFDVMDLDVLEAAAQPANAASFAVLAGCGMRRVGERHVYAPSRGQDELCIVYSMTRSQFGDLQIHGSATS